jgi:membrane-associated phospholipid phosphatase
MGRGTTGRRTDHLRRGEAPPLLPPAARLPAGALVAVCTAVTAALGAWTAGQAGPGWLDAAVDGRLRAALGGHPGLLHKVAMLGAPVPVNVIAAALVLACLAARRWRGAVLVAVAVPAAEALTELALKPIFGRTLAGALSFPSGHVTGIGAIAAGVCVLLAARRRRVGVAVRVLAAVCAVLAAASVAVALIGLGAHYFTDTVGGAAVGTAVVLATALMLDRAGLPERLLRPRRPASAGGPHPAARAGVTTPASGAVPRD